MEHEIVPGKPNRMSSRTRARVWSKNDGAFGICIDSPGALMYDNNTSLEIEMTPDQMIEMATDMLVMARQKQKKPPLHQLGCLYVGRPVERGDSCGCDVV